MAIKGISHNALEVRNMDRSLRFYRDLLGLRVTLDTIEENQRVGKRRAVYLRSHDGPDAYFIVLAEYLDMKSMETPLRGRLGIDHYAFWVDNIQDMYQKLTTAGVKAMSPPREVDTAAYGEPTGGKVITVFFLDPDGIPVQLDQRVAVGTGAGPTSRSRRAS